MKSYLRDHWAGRHSLVWSIWVNLVLLRVIILYFERFTHPPYLDQSTAAILLTVSYAVTFHVFVFTWQARGVIRACDRFAAGRAVPMTVLAVQAMVVVCLLFTLVYAFSAFHSLFTIPDEDRFKPTRPPPVLEPYSLSLSEDGRFIAVDGDFRLGLTNELETLLDAHPGVQGIVFHSDGGRVAEGRGVARLMERKGLDSYVFDVCKSACTTAFIGGAKRYLGAKGRLGFHQFKLDSVYHTPFVDPKVEQDEDLKYYAERKIDPAFLKKVFQASHADIWYPSAEDLVAAGVVLRVLPASAARPKFK